MIGVNAVDKDLGVLVVSGTSLGLTRASRALSIGSPGEINTLNLSQMERDTFASLTGRQKQRTE